MLPDFDFDGDVDIVNDSRKSIELGRNKFGLNIDSYLGITRQRMKIIFSDLREFTFNLLGNVVGVNTRNEFGLSKLERETKPRLVA